MSIFLFPIFIFLFLIVVAILFLGNIVRMFFGGFRRNSYNPYSQQQSASQSRRDDNDDDDDDPTEPRRKKKVFDRSVGEYVDFEEIKDK